MKINKYSSILLLLLLFRIHIQAQTNGESLIALRNISIYPTNISEPGSGIEKITDGKCWNDSEIFHTLWSGIPVQNITIEADLEGNQKQLDKVILIPRSYGVNGIIKNAELWIKEKGKYILIALIEGNLSNSPIQIELDRSIKNPEKIKLVITDSYGDSSSDLYMVSLGELKCVMMPEDAITRGELLTDSEVFSGLKGIALKTGITKQDIEKMRVPALKNLATGILNKTFKPDSLLVQTHAYLNPDVLGEKMHIGNGFSKYEGITGIFLDKGVHIIFVDKTNDIPIKLLVPDWTRKPPKGIKPDEDPLGWGLKKEEFILKEGVNLIHIENAGNAYVQYFVDQNPDKYPPITLHFPTGQFNGIFDTTKGDDDEDFNRLLENSKSPILDMKGKYIQVAFPVESLKKYTWGEGVELIKNYDSIVGMQRYFSGWDKESFTPKNHILVRVNYQYYMFRDQDGIAFIDGAMRLVADPSSVFSGDACWGFCHEGGHIFQLKHQMTWGGMTEVSNNILTMFCMTSLGNKSRLASENRYTQAKETILDKGISYMDFPGKVGANTNHYGGNGNTDVFQRLVPFWQLYLYFKEQGHPDFYQDLMIAMRKQPPIVNDNKNNDYHNMLEFCRLACEISKTDLTDFFERWGFFYIGEIDVNDYVQYIYNVSAEDIESVKRDIADMNLPKPKTDITLIED